MNPTTIIGAAAKAALTTHRSNDVQCTVSTS
jgi:hypothetical protein